MLASLEMRLPFGLLLLPLLGCHSVQDLDIQYQDCVEVAEKNYLEEFDGNSTRPLRDSHCWKTDNEGVAPGGIDSKIFIEDGDLIMRVDDTTPDPDAASPDLDEWTSTDQAPMFFRRLTGDFLVVVRAEASSFNGDHCMEMGMNRAGLVLRQADDRSVWTTWTVTPFLGSSAVCDDDDDETNNPTATVEVRSSNPAFATFTKDDQGADGEADLAICRLGSKVYYYYGRSLAPEDPTKNAWLPKTGSVPDAGSVDAGDDAGPDITEPTSHAIGAGPLDVGLTAAGTSPFFEVAGHFNWIVFEQGVKGDGCAGALEEFTLPEDK